MVPRTVTMVPRLLAIHNGPCVTMVPEFPWFACHNDPDLMSLKGPLVMLWAEVVIMIIRVTLVLAIVMVRMHGPDVTHSLMGRLRLPCWSHFPWYCCRAMR